MDYNPDQLDADSDTVGDACDNCVSVYNPGQEDTNSNGVGDACEGPPCDDNDGDGFCNDDDNCRGTYNPDQLDDDNDTVGDACDVIITDPVDGQVLECRDVLRGVEPRPRIRWNPGRYDRFRAMISWDQNFPRRKRVTSGVELLTGTSWRPSQSKWREACRKASPFLYIRVLGVNDDVPGRNATKKTQSNIVAVDTLK